jgi:hypothetical protein
MLHRPRRFRSIRASRRLAGSGADRGLSGLPVAPARRLSGGVWATNPRRGSRRVRRTRGVPAVALRRCVPGIPRLSPVSTPTIAATTPVPLAW